MPDAERHPTGPPHPVKPAVTVLLVEDDKPTRDLYAMALTVSGYRVRSVGDGLDALRSLECDGLPDAIVLDLMLPSLPGLDVARDVRAHAETRYLPIVIVTGADISEIDLSEFRYVLQKPIAPDTLLFAVGTSLQRARRRRPSEHH